MDGAEVLIKLVAAFLEESDYRCVLVEPNDCGFPRGMIKVYTGLRSFLVGLPIARIVACDETSVVVNNRPGALWTNCINMADPSSFDRITGLLEVFGERT